MKTATKPNHTTREEWLRAMATALSPMFAAAGHTLPEKLRVSVGWPTRKALAERGRVLGQCFTPECSKDGHTEIFVSPVMGTGPQAAGVLAHELVHAAVKTPGHGKVFTACATAIGLEGKPTEALPGKALTAKLAELIKQVGPFPHATLDLKKMAKAGRKQSRVPLRCPDCGYLARTSPKWAEMGLPTCPCGTKMEVIGGEGSDDNEE